MRGFIKHFSGGLLRNLPLALGGGFLLLLSFLFDLSTLRYIAVSLFICYGLSCLFQAFYGISEKGAQMQHGVLPGKSAGQKSAQGRTGGRSAQNVDPNAQVNIGGGKTTGKTGKTPQNDPPAAQKTRGAAQSASLTEQSAPSNASLTEQCAPQNGGRSSDDPSGSV